MRILKVGLMASLAGGLLGALIAVPAQAGDPEAGQQPFQQLCATCHGATGKGDGPASAALNPKPRDMSDSEWQAEVDDDYLRTVIRDGGRAVGLSQMMTPFGGALNEQQLEDVVAFIRTLDD